MKFTFAPVAFLLVGLHAVAAADTTLELIWTVKSYDDQTAQVGDTITFDFSGSSHNVFIHPSGSCDDTGAIEVGTSGPVTYTFIEEDAGKDILFACEVEGHCDAGQSIKVSVTAADGETPTAAPVLTSGIEDGAGGLEAGAIAGIAVGVGVVLLLPILLFAYRRSHRSDGATSIQSHVPRDPPAHYGIPTHEDQVWHGQNSDNREPTGQLENREPAAAPLVAARVIYDDSGPLADVNLPDFKDQVRRSTNPTPVAKAKVQDSDSISV